MHHIVAFEEDVGQAANTEMDLIQDQIVNGDSGQAFFQQDMRCVGIYASSATMTRARITSPKLRQVYIPYVFPFNLALLPVNDPNVMDLRNNPMELRGLERFVPEATSGIACGTERAYVVMVCQSVSNVAPSGEMFTLRATGGTTLAQGVWGDVPLTFDQQIARGRYAIVGGHCQGATIVAWRLILENQVERPGGLGQASLGSRTHKMFMNGGLGSWGEFFSTGLPRLQCLANAADTAQALFLQVVRVGA